MIFSKNETVFPSVIHQAIWNAARRIFPLEKSFPAIVDDEVRATCTDLHNLVMDGYEDIYYNPAVYGVDPMDAEVYLGGRPWSKAIILAINKEDQGALDYFKRTESRLHFFRFICNKIMSENTVMHSQGAYFSKDSYKKLLSLARKHHGYDKERFVRLMERLSFVITPDGDNFVVTNTKYPQMFKALKRLHKVDMKQAANKTRALSAACEYLDFRVLMPNYACSFEDALYSLDDANTKELIRLDAFLAALNIKRECKLNNVNWIFMKKKIVSFSGRKEHYDINKSGNENNLITIYIDKSWSFHWPNIRPNFGPEKNTENREAFESAVEGLPNADGMKAFCIKHFKRCRECGCLFAPPPRGHPKVMFDKIFYSCGGGTSFGVEHLTRDNFDFVTGLIKIRLGHFSEGR
ncbi:MAG: hypothetical protein FWD90_01980 [Defluviitaleaceae bacterium]|nr:hypothetical protein [Defluviitaleaceae bacterium]